MAINFPDDFLERISGQDYLDAGSLLGALDGPAPVSIRINPMKWSGKPVESTPVPWCSSGHYLQSSPSFTSDPLFHAGCYYVQEASSMFLETVAREAGIEGHGLRILDICAAPGGKTTHLASLAGKGSAIIANEVIRPRASVLAENIVKWGTGNVMVTGSDPSAFSKLAGYFDIILVDAPCSGEGMFREEVARSQWSVDNCSLNAGRQRRILSDVWPSLKEGGWLIYSTCTFNPAENEDQIVRLLEEKRCSLLKPEIGRFPGITPVSISGGLAGWGFHPGRVRGEGFFISAIRKEEPQQPVKTGAKPARSRGSISGKMAGRAIEYAIVPDNYIDDFGGTAIALPLPVTEFRMLAENLRIVKAGTALFTRKRETLVPCHDLSMSVNFRREVLPIVEVSYEEAVGFLQRNVMQGIRPAGQGWSTVVYRGVPLGFIRDLGNRINNYYPSEWRIRKASFEGEPGII
jgi:16S rRNA C967 or C1407 C5-methylase (RsmB/RsmF family)/NOL1/NOP2/fmu family ribosome biogenesis protein